MDQEGKITRMNTQQRSSYLFLLQRTSIAARREAAKRLRELGMTVVAQYGGVALEAFVDPAQSEAAQALGILSRITCAISNCRSSSLLRRGACVGSIRSAPTPAPCLGAGEETTLVIAERHYHTVAAGVPTNSPTVDLHTISSAAALSGCADATVRFTCTVFQ